jgi:hypothetical protein
MADRADLYESRIAGVVVNPLAMATLKNVYVATIMGLSAMVPTVMQCLVALWSFYPRPAPRDRWAFGVIAVPFNSVAVMRVTGCHRVAASAEPRCPS